MTGYNKVKDFLLQLEYSIVVENEEEQVLIISDEASGINNLVLVCADPILIMEQHMFDIKTNNDEVYKVLLQKNRDIIHGAFALTEEGDKVIFRDTLQLENLDLNELEGSINSLSLLLSEFAQSIIEISESFNIEAKIVGRVESFEGKKLTINSEFGTFEY